MKKVRIVKLQCAKCGEVWMPRVANPKRCPNAKCQTPYWNKKKGSK